MKISSKGINLICEFEGYSNVAYKDIAGIYTIGYGIIKYPDGKPVLKDDKCTKEQALEWLNFEVEQKCRRFNMILKEIDLKLNQNQYDALCSFFYNVGIGKCEKGSSMGDAIHSKNTSNIANSFLIYCKYTKLGIKLTSKGLLKRRMAEKELFESIPNYFV